MVYSTAPQSGQSPRREVQFPPDRSGDKSKTLIAIISNDVQAVLFLQSKKCSFQKVGQLIFNYFSRFEHGQWSDTRG